MAFFEDPRLRQRWNQIAHDAETVTENAAAGIWSFQHNYINPCFGFIAGSIEQCTTVCLGDPEERLRRRRERERAGDLAEYSFDFYDDWYQEEESEGLLGSWRGEDWDRLLAGTGSQRRLRGVEAAEQPRRKAGMSYGTRGARRNTVEADATIIPSTQPIGLLSKLPWKMGGTLRYKPSAANLKEHPGKARAGESAPLLGLEQDASPLRRERSGTTGSGDTSDSYRSRGDLFPSDGEGEEDAVPIDDEITYEMIRKDDQSNGSKGGDAQSSHGKQPVTALASSRTVSRSTLNSVASIGSRKTRSRASKDPSAGTLATDRSSSEPPHVEEAGLQQSEDIEVASKTIAAVAPTEAEKLLGSGEGDEAVADPVVEPKTDIDGDEAPSNELEFSSDRGTLRVSAEPVSTSRERADPRKRADGR